MKSLTLALASAFLVSHATAATIVVPSTDSNGDGLNTIIRTLPRVYESYIDESQLGSLTQPIQITGMRFRLSTGDTWRPSGYVGSS